MMRRSSLPASMAVIACRRAIGVGSKARATRSPRIAVMTSARSPWRISWRAALQRRTPLKVRRNYPYAGRNDGLTTAFRRRFPASRYLGIELEINQRHPLRDGPGWHAMRRMIVAALSDALLT